MKNFDKTFKIVVEYDGTCYHGWQRQKEKQTIQGDIEEALSVMTSQRIVLVGSGRTDAGVHAFGQVASFKAKTNLTAKVFHKGLNSLLSKDIVIKSCERISNDFHARFDAKSKTYRYYIVNDRLAPAIGRRFVWYIDKKLNLKMLKLASSSFLGCHDFKAFESSGSPRDNSVRIITKSSVELEYNNIITYTVEANGFLRHMVRNIVGTLVSVSLGKFSLNHVFRLLMRGNRREAGMMAPPQGLFLVSVEY